MEKTEQKKRRKAGFSLAAKLIIMLILISVGIAAVSVIVGRNAYMDDITAHYNSLAHGVADTVSGVLTREKLEKWGNTAVAFAKGQIGLEERAVVAEDPDYLQTKALVENLCEKMSLNDIYIAVYDIETADAFTQESYDAKEWKPLIYIIDAYMIPEEQYPFGAASRVNVTVKDALRSRWVTATQVDSSKTIVTYYNGQYILTGSSLVIYDGRSCAVIGVEIGIPTLEDDLKSFTWQIILADLVILAAVIVIAVILLLLFIVKPIRLVADEAERFVSDNANVSEKLGKIKTHDEIQVLSESLLSLEYGVKEYIDNITAMTAEKERIGAELSVATHIQTDMLPADFPKREEFELYARMTPAKEVGGDFYDFFMTDEDHMCLVMADVSGKGVPAALFMAITKAVLSNTAHTGRKPSEILGIVNGIMCENNKSNYFVTVWLGILTLSTGELIYSNAGHEYPALCRNGDGFTLLESEQLPPVAAMEDMEYSDNSVKLYSGDMLFLYTDGLPEAKAADNSRFGTQKMLDLLSANKNRTPEELVGIMMDEVMRFDGENDLFDDITMMCLKWNERGGTGAVQSYVEAYLE